MSNDIFRRVSVREYTDQPVEEEVIESLLRAAMAAPSAGNQRPWEYYVIQDKSRLEQLSECSPYARCVKEAPIAFVACSRRKRIMFPECVLLDMSASVENLLLQCVSHEMGGVWLAVAPFEERIEAVNKILDLPESLNAFAIIPVGYPVENKDQEDRYDEGRIHYV